MIKVDLITGFLGSGKTTFLTKYARYLMRQGLRIGILEYDYGAINVDMLLLNKLRGPKCELEMVAAACDEDCLRRRFKTKLIAMAMSGYDRVIIEPSGVFDMDMFFDTLRDEPLDQWYEIGSVITIVNSNLGEELSREEDFYLASQAASAGKILFSRTQLVPEEKLEAAKKHILEAAEAIQCKKLKNNFEARLMTKTWDELEDADYKALSEAGYVIGDYMKLIAGGEKKFTTFYYLDQKDDLEMMKKKVDRLLHDASYGNVIRIKGFVCEQGGSYQINASRSELFVEQISLGQGIMIVIGTDLKKDRIDALMQEETL